MASFANEIIECCICFENIGSKNNCVTPCGHSFCFQCMMMALAKKNTCPCCRQVLCETSVTTDEEEEYEDDENSDEESETESEDDARNENEHVDIITERFMGLGHTPEDLISMLTGRINRGDAEKYNQAYLSAMYDKLDDIMLDVDVQQKELLLFAAEDLRAQQ